MWWFCTVGLAIGVVALALLARRPGGAKARHADVRRRSIVARTRQAMLDAHRARVEAAKRKRADEWASIVRDHVARQAVLQRASCEYAVQMRPAKRPDTRPERGVAMSTASPSGTDAP